MYNKYDKGQKFADNVECKPNCSAAESLTVGPVGALSCVTGRNKSRNDVDRTEWTGQSVCPLCLSALILLNDTTCSAELSGRQVFRNKFGAIILCSQEHKMDSPTTVHAAHCHAKQGSLPTLECMLLV